MIIECPNCQKKFEVNSSLIPDNGRIIQCGSCNYTWNFIKNNVEKKTQNLEIKISDNLVEPQKSKIENVKKEQIRKKKINKTKTISVSKILSYLLVFIITFIAFIILVDTFKIPLSNYFPQLELIVFNLFETLEDIYLFIKDLLF